MEVTGQRNPTVTVHGYGADHDDPSRHPTQPRAHRLMTAFTPRIPEPQTPQHTLAVLAQHQDPEVRAGVVVHPATSEGVLAKLADDKELEVRLQVIARVSAGMPTPEAALARLAMDSHYRVRAELVECPNLTPYVLRILKGDQSRAVQLRAQERLTQMLND